MEETKGQEIQKEAQARKDRMLENQLKALLIRVYCKLVEKLRLADEKYHEYVIRYEKERLRQEEKDLEKKEEEKKEQEKQKKEEEKDRGQKDDQKDATVLIDTLTTQMILENAVEAYYRSRREKAPEIGKIPSERWKDIQEHWQRTELPGRLQKDLAKIREIQKERQGLLKEKVKDLVNDRRIPEERRQEMNEQVELAGGMKELDEQKAGEIVHDHKEHMEADIQNLKEKKEENQKSLQDGKPKEKTEAKSKEQDIQRGMERKMEVKDA